MSAASTRRLIQRIADERMKVQAKKKPAAPRVVPAGSVASTAPVTGQGAVVVASELVPRMYNGTIDGITYNVAGRTVLNDWINIDNTFSGNMRIGDAPPTVADPTVNPT